MSDGRRTAKLKTQRECSMCGAARIGVYRMWVERQWIVLMCPRCDGRP